jgi:hypothetical protein
VVRCLRDDMVRIQFLQQFPILILFLIHLMNANLDDCFMCLLWFPWFCLDGNKIEYTNTSLLSGLVRT